MLFILVLGAGALADTQPALRRNRIDWGAGFRIYLHQDGDDLVVLLGGGTKKRQQMDIAKARELLKEYRFRR